jgi:hypothetical protein
MPTLNDQAKILAVWNKGRTLFDRDPTKWRLDQGGNLIYYPAYGDHSSFYGWEIDMIVPGGSETMSNLCPRHWSSVAIAASNAEDQVQDAIPAQSSRW